jgi:hypothetical protein
VARGRSASAPVQGEMHDANFERSRLTAHLIHGPIIHRLRSGLQDLDELLVFIAFEYIILALAKLLPVGVDTSARALLQLCFCLLPTELRLVGQLGSGGDSHQRTGGHVQQIELPRRDSRSASPDARAKDGLRNERNREATSVASLSLLSPLCLFFLRARRAHENSSVQCTTCSEIYRALLHSALSNGRNRRNGRKRAQAKGALVLRPGYRTAARVVCYELENIHSCNGNSKARVVVHDPCLAGSALLCGRVCATARARVRSASPPSR